MGSTLDSILKVIGIASPIIFIFSILVGVFSVKIINSRKNSELMMAKFIEDRYRINELKKRIKGLKVIAEELGVSEEDLEKFLLFVKASRDMEKVENNGVKKSAEALKNLSEYLTNKTPLDPLMKELPK